MVWGGGVLNTVTFYLSLTLQFFLAFNNNWEIETVLFMVLLIQDFEILGLGGAGENLMFSPE